MPGLATEASNRARALRAGESRIGSPGQAAAMTRLRGWTRTHPERSRSARPGNGALSQAGTRGCREPDLRREHTGGASLRQRSTARRGGRSASCAQSIALRTRHLLARGAAAGRMPTRHRLRRPVSEREAERKGRWQGARWRLSSVRNRARWRIEPERGHRRLTLSFAVPRGV